MELSELKGIGTRTEELFHKIGIYTPCDLLYYFPADYIYYSEPVPIGTLEEGGPRAVRGILERDAAVYYANGKAVLTVYIRDISGRLKLTWFNAPYLRTQLRSGMVMVFWGKVSRYDGQLVMAQPVIFRIKEYEGLRGKLSPVYGQTKGLGNKVIQKSVMQLLDIMEKDEGAGILREDFLPKEILERRKLPSLSDSVRGMHFPSSPVQLCIWRGRLSYDELFIFSVAMLFKKDEMRRKCSDYVMKSFAQMDHFLSELPFRMTPGQTEALKAIRMDLSGGFIMNRLLMGDVGSGKTIVAFAAMLAAAENGFQSAFMAPTALLALQHFEKMKDLIVRQGLPFKVQILIGAMPEKEKREARKKIREGGVDFIIGTHALFQDKVEYAALGLVITDEQHRFGVRQRGDLEKKGKYPHVLAMSATPIPRTMAMFLYSDLSVSTLEGLPAGRLPRKNAVVGEEYRQRAYKFIYDEVKKGRQAYIVCPMIDPNDTLDLQNVHDYAAEIRRIFPREIRTALLHGKMAAEEKEAVMRRFLHDEIDILVCTTVVEVGVDVPNASVMMVENAERFGLASLHQLRGRVGRSTYQGYCIFVDTQKSELSQKRLGILSSSNDGFFIAEEDLKLRGPGEFFGLRQSGEMRFQYADIYRDRKILEDAYEDARSILIDDPGLKKDGHTALLRALERYMSPE